MSCSCRGQAPPKIRQHAWRRRSINASIWANASCWATLSLSPTRPKVVQSSPGQMAKIQFVDAPLSQVVGLLALRARSDHD